MEIEKKDLLLQVVHMYYGLGMTQEEIANLLFFSRSRISHLIAEAEEAGLVMFEMRQQVPRNILSQDFLRERYHLKNVFVEEDNYLIDSEQYENIYKVAADYLSSQFKKDTVLTISRGRTSYGIVQSLKAVAPIPTMSVVQTEGILLMNDPYLEQMDFVRKIAEIFSCQYECLMLPYLFESADQKRIMLAVPFCQETFAKQETVNLICSSISSLQQWRRYIFNEEYNWLVANGAVGSILGNFYDINGKFLVSPLHKRSIVPSISVLCNAEQLVCVCIGNYKESALLGILRSGLVTTLVTNAQLAQRIQQIEAEK